MNPFLLIGIALVALLAVCVLWGAWRAIRKPHDPDFCAANTWDTATVGTHTNSLQKKADGVIARYLLVKTGSDENHVDVCGTGDVPVGVTDDESAAAEDGLTVLLLGGATTRKLTASEAITDGALVYQAASGKVATTGTNCVGWAVTNASGDGSIVEVMTKVPDPSPGVAASTFDANTILKADSDNTPVALTVAASRVVGRKSTGSIAAMTGDETYSVIEAGSVRFTAGPVAAAGTTVADAAALTLSRFTQISSDGATKGVKLPTTAAGQWGFVYNTSGTAAEFYAASGGTVNGLGADASVVVPASKGLLWFATAADTIIAFDLTAKATAS